MGEGDSMHARIVWAHLVCATLAGCLQPQSASCGDLVCATGQVCSPDRARCVLPEQIVACSGQADGAVCQFSGTADGACYAGACLATGCGNGVVEGGEVCDDRNKVGGDGCSANCKSDESCGNGTIDPIKEEACDCGSDGSPPGCNGQPNGDGDTSVCRSDCTLRGCGDGVATSPEECDSSDLASTTCSTLGFYGTTGLACSSRCRFDVTGCESYGWCGDGTINGSEACDATSLAGKDCLAFGFYNAPGLSCAGNCRFDVSQCTGYCGDGIKNGSEDCDQSDVGAQTCGGLGYYSGTLGCTSGCRFDLGTCQGRCGDGTIDTANDRDREIDRPLELRVLLALRESERQRDRGRHDDRLPAPEVDLREPLDGPRLEQALRRVVDRRKDAVAGECEDHRVRVQRSQAAEREVRPDIQARHR